VVFDNPLTPRANLASPNRLIANAPPRPTCQWSPPEHLLTCAVAEPPRRQSRPHDLSSVSIPRALLQYSNPTTSLSNSPPSLRHLSYSPITFHNSTSLSAVFVHPPRGENGGLKFPKNGGRKFLTPPGPCTPSPEVVLGNEEQENWPTQRICPLQRLKVPPRTKKTQALDTDEVGFPLLGQFSGFHQSPEEHIPGFLTTGLNLATIYA